MSKFIFSSPGKYVQGSGVLDELGEYLPALGGKSFLIADDVSGALSVTASRHH